MRPARFSRNFAAAANPRLVNGRGRTAAEGSRAATSVGLCRTCCSTTSSSRRSSLCHSGCRQLPLPSYMRTSSSRIISTSRVKRSFGTRSGMLTSSLKTSSMRPRFGDLRRPSSSPCSLIFRIHFSTAMGCTRRTRCVTVNLHSFVFSGAKDRVWISTRRSSSRTMSMT